MELINMVADSTQKQLHTPFVKLVVENKHGCKMKIIPPL